MSIIFEQVVFDCTDAAELAAFWAGVLNTTVDADGNEFFATVNKGGEGLALMFLQVPEPKSGKNRLHLDFGTADWAAEVDRIVGLGAKRVGEHNEYGTHWITLADPDGNVFDLAELH
ncbi:VOC family protein [Kribbella sp. CA-293567]|uniref:VOC family protein n=1 Tax=Kribbella sp. CA-293567 TaxID=3002436 RepID=UPI0022DDDADD|nr:VOC family protein [Kribbella sp. CA-293567]WBQ07153.1 VOC family protein [Kribbella sp. CA-293567]